MSERRLTFFYIIVVSGIAMFSLLASTAFLRDVLILIGWQSTGATVLTSGLVLKDFNGREATCAEVKVEYFIDNNRLLSVLNFVNGACSFDAKDIAGLQSRYHNWQKITVLVHPDKHEFVVPVDFAKQSTSAFLGYFFTAFIGAGGSLALIRRYGSINENRYRRWS